MVRIVDGQPREGRYISPAAYSAYAHASELQARGDLAGARQALEDAASEDPNSVEIRTSQADVACQLDPAKGEAEFARAEALDPGYEPLWRARARCYERRGMLEKARDAALRAASLDPDRLGTSLLVADLLEKTGQAARTRRWLFALAVRHPGAVPAWQALLGFAQRQKDAALLHYAARQLEQRFPERPLLRNESELTTQLARALGHDDLARARSLALVARIAPAELALRAAALGYPQAAKQQAELVLRSDPGNADAWIASLVALDLLGKQQEFADELSRLGEPFVPASPLGVQLLGELLERRLGPQAAAAWQEALASKRLPGEAGLQ